MLCMCPDSNQMDEINIPCGRRPQTDADGCNTPLISALILTSLNKVHNVLCHHVPALVVICNRIFCLGVCRSRAVRIIDPYAYRCET